MKNITSLYFNTKRAILLTACIIAILALSGTGMAFAATSAASTISLDAAKEIALSDAGVSASDATFTKAELDRDDGITIYEIEFLTASAEYEYEINAATGAILDRDVEVRKNSTSSTGNTSGTGTTVSEAITLEEAKAIALSDAGVSAADVTFTKAKSDMDEGISVYDIEFYTSTAEYEYEINAATGAILDRDVETRKNSASSTGNTSGSNAGYESTPYTRGDADGNSQIDTGDALFVLKASIKLSSLTAEQAEAADVDQNNVINTVDALYILKYCVKLIQQFPN